ncbi:MAG: tetratricopeptide repeat protein, partial [Lacunisphaera sp.]
LNVALHGTAACLFGTLLQRLRIPGAWFAALLFALHPVCVESVAWISEQKNTLSTVFYLTSALLYFRYRESGRRSHYSWATGLFVLALLTKTVTASLPAALLVIFWWQQGQLNWRRDVWPLLPWFALAVISGLVTAGFERELIGAQGADFNLDFLQRCLLAGRVFWFYLGKLIWPADLIFIYPHWTVTASEWWQWIFPVAAMALLAGLIVLARKKRGPLAVMLLFVGTLFPVLGFVNVFPFLFSYVADHFQYLASLAIFASAGISLQVGFSKLPRGLGTGVTVALAAGLGLLTWAQSGMYRDITTLYQTTLERNPDCWMAHNNLALILADTGHIDQAITHLKNAIRLKPDYALAENNLGNDLIQLDRPAEAVPHLQRALALQPNYAVAERNLGIALAAVGKTSEAIPHFENALRLKPNFAEAELSLGTALMLTNRFPEAVPHFEKAVALAPDSIEISDTYGRALMQAGQFEQSLEHFRHVLELDPGRADTHMNLALALRQLGRKQEAAGEYLEAVRLNPSLGQTH